MIIATFTPVIYFADVNVKNIESPSTARPPILKMMRK